VANSEGWSGGKRTPQRLKAEWHIVWNGRLEEEPVWIGGGKREEGASAIGDEGQTMIEAGRNDRGSAVVLTDLRSCLIKIFNILRADEREMRHHFISYHIISYCIISFSIDKLKVECGALKNSEGFE
jgi:hypothetical protein